MNVDVENLFQYKDTVLDVDREATYCISHDSDCGSDEGSNRPDYNFEELEAFAKESRRCYNSNSYKKSFPAIGHSLENGAAKPGSLIGHEVPRRETLGGPCRFEDPSGKGKEGPFPPQGNPYHKVKMVPTL
ncbi:hypothetical protein HAX54_047105 [Datura stramonium]|uniref:Uncharacterized protein n=1 Tax=Datura stramonium TaxID=4076 RepID=A0ABS8SRY0_DATST|nr:hypothetical protein [Datura stramonium]